VKEKMRKKCRHFLTSAVDAGDTHDTLPDSLQKQNKR